VAETLADAIRTMRVEPGTSARIRERDPRDTLGFEKAAGKQLLAGLHERLQLLQQRLYAEAERSVLLVLQGLDASGKDGVIRSVFSGLNPLSCRAVSFKAPSPNELAHDYLWRVHAQVPARGELGIFNRSHYEDVVTVRVRKLAPEAVVARRPGHICEWERMLSEEGTTPVKVFLNVSKDE
jgi:polyphosphate kinase 2 (PPK2 family)